MHSPPPPPPVQSGGGGPSSLLGGTDVGGLCIIGSAALWSMVSRKLLPLLHARAMQSTWWATGKLAQKRRLWESGFPRTEEPPGFPLGTTDGMAADMFGWFCLCGAVNLLGGTLTLPAVLLGWDNAGDMGQGGFLLAVLLVAGWSLFDAVDGVLRAWLFGRFPTGCSGLAFPCPRQFWLRHNLLHNPFWVTLVLPMNSRLPDLGAYHLIAGSLMLSMAYQHISGCERYPALQHWPTYAKRVRKRVRVCVHRQYGVTLDLTDVRCLRRLKKLVVAQLLSAASIRGALFIFLAIRCTEQLRANVDQSTADYAVVPGLLMLMFNASVIIDSLKAAVWWLPARKQGTRAMRQEAATIPLTPADAAGGMDEDSLHRPRPRGRSSGRPPRPKAKVANDAAGQEASDEDLVFGGAGDIEDGQDAAGEMSPAGVAAGSGAAGAAPAGPSGSDGLRFGGRRDHDDADNAAAASHAPNGCTAEQPAPQFAHGRFHAGKPSASGRAESVVFPSAWAGAVPGGGDEEDEDDDEISMVSAPITPMERQRRMAHSEREKKAALEAGKAAKARTEAAEAERRREKAAKRSREAERRKREEEEQVRDRRRRRAEANASEQAANASAEPKMVDHDAVLSSGKLPQCDLPLKPGPAPLRLALFPHCLERSRHFGRGNHYEMLGVHRNADEATVKKAFYTLSRKWHPDKNPEHVAEAETVFKAIKLAYDVLADHGKRRKYDAKLDLETRFQSKERK